MEDGSSNINDEDLIILMFNPKIKFYVTSYPLYGII
jgi:hypothetical protein